MKGKVHLIISLGLFFLVQAGGICWSQSTVRVSVDSVGVEGDLPSVAPSISDNGRYVAFESDATNLLGAGNDVNGWSDIFVRDRQTATTTRVSIHSDGMTEGDDRSNSPSISGDGRHVAFESWATSLVTIGDGIFPDIFVHNRQGGNTLRVSVDSAGAEGGGPSFHPSISSNGRYVAFDSDADLVAADSGAYYDIFVHDRDADGNGTYDEAAPVGISTIRVSVDAGGNEVNGHSYSPAISGNGRYVAFESFAADLVVNDTNTDADIFVHDRDADGDGIYDDEDGTYDFGEVSTVRVSVDSDGGEGIGGDSSSCSISSNGRYVAFESLATNLVPNDTNGSTDIFVHDRDADGDGIYDDEDGTYDFGEVSTVRVSVHSTGMQGNGNSNFPSISSDGRYVTFESDASNLVDNDTNGSTDIFVHDLQTGVTTLVSVDSSENQGNGNSSAPAISADGQYVAFGSDSNNLVSGDGNGVFDIFVYEGDPLPPNTTESEENNSSANISCFIATAASDWADF